MAVHAHADRWAVGAAVLEEGSGVVSRALDELCRVREVDRRDRERARRRHDDQLGVVPMQLDVSDQPAVGEQLSACSAMPSALRGGVSSAHA